MKDNKTNDDHELKRNMEIAIDFPKCVHIELVQINELRHYEIFSWLGSIFATSAAGFWVAFATTTHNNILLGVSLVFTFFTLIFGGMAFYYRQRLNGGKITKLMSIQDLN